MNKELEEDCKSLHDTASSFSLPKNDWNSLMGKEEEGNDQPSTNTGATSKKQSQQEEVAKLSGLASIEKTFGSISFPKISLPNLLIVGLATG